MAKRRKRFTQTSTPRFRVKMYDYLGRGGRVPSVIAMEVADAVTSEWSKGFGGFSAFKEKRVFPVLDDLDIPYIVRGIIVGQAMKIYKKFTEPPREYIEMVAKEVGLDQITIKNWKGTDILLAIFGYEELTTTSKAGGAQEEQSPQS